MIFKKLVLLAIFVRKWQWQFSKLSVGIDSELFKLYSKTKIVISKNFLYMFYRVDLFEKFELLLKKQGQIFLNFPYRIRLRIVQSVFENKLSISIIFTSHEFPWRLSRFSKSGELKIRKSRPDSSSDASSSLSLEH